MTQNPIANSTTILVIDDDEMTRLMVRETLVLAGFEVIEAEGGAAGIEEFRRSQPDLVLLDLMMPGVDGFEVCRTIREDPAGKRVPIVTLTGSDDVEFIQRAYDLGATDFITKPLQWLILEHRIHHLLRANHNLKQLEHSRSRLANAQRIARLGSWEWNPKSNHLQFSEEACRILGLPEDTNEISAHSWLERFHEHDRDMLKDWQATTRAGHDAATIESRVILSNGSKRIVRQRASLIVDASGQVQRVNVVVYDVTEWRRAEEEIKYRATHDPGTKLENRDSFLLSVGEAIDNLRLDERFAIFFIGLDRFKNINDSHGRDVGDTVLRLAADRLNSLCNNSDCENLKITHVARIGGDEFALLLQPLAHVQDAARVASSVHEILADKFQSQDSELFVSACIGVAIYPDDANTPTELMNTAHIAGNHAKSIGRGETHFSTPSMNAEAAHRLSMEINLHGAWERGEMEVFYQPKVETQTGQVVGVEALLRWHHPTLGIVSPVDFVPIAEESGLIVPIGEWVLRTACRQAKQWQEVGLPAVRVAANFSAEQFRHGNPAQLVQQVLEETNLAPNWLEVELTESILMSNPKASASTLRELKELGVNIAMDDFGTGYSSLSYVRQFPFDVLKIDQSFIKDLPHDKAAVSITTAILLMARSLDLEVVAEGVETKDQLDFLRSLRCDQYQGYYFSPPVPADVATALIPKAPRSVVNPLLTI